MKKLCKLILNPSFILFILVLSACQTTQKGEHDFKLSTEFALYSKEIRDTFHISVQLPLEYKEHPNKHYPVVVLTDANFYCPMLAPVLHQYEKGGLLPPLILVGVGYNSFKAMDSLRVRDYLYPKAIPSDEMKAPGGGQLFYQFITNKLLPKIDSNYRTENTNRTLLGHSFGGYFSLYALLEQLSQKRNDFKGFVSASPSLWYNNNYLFQLPQKLKTNMDSLNLFLSVGDAETPKEWTVEPLKNMSKRLISSGQKNIKLNTEIYNNLDHMDAGLISFIRGIEMMYTKHN